MTRPLALCLALIVPALAYAEPPKPVRVFILAGQSNMEGKAKVSLFDTQAERPATLDLFKHLRRDGKWTSRADVWVKFFDRKGDLTVGFGSPNCVGPELGFGTVVGDRYDEQVLLIKTAWGGRSLFRDFRPPSAGLPADAALEKLLADARKRNPAATLDDVKKPFGAAYRDMIAEVKATLADPKKFFPGYAGQGVRLEGFVWFQGWNDMISPDATAEYAANLAHLIRDVRKDLGAPKLPAVVGEMGIEGADPGANIRKFKEAQAVALRADEFKGNAVLVRTDLFWDAEAEAVYKKGWREHLGEWNLVGSDYPYHYLGSAKTMLAIGRALGEAAVALGGQK